MLFLAAAKFAIRSPILPPIKRETLFIRRILKVAQISIILQRFPILNIEIALGRKRKIPLGPRIIDIDIIYYNDEIMNTSSLTIPHPSMSQRKFVLMPLTEIRPDFMHPILLKSNEVLLKECEDSSVVYKKSSE